MTSDSRVQARVVSWFSCGAASAVCKDRKGMVFLDTLDPKRGNPVKDAPADCGFTCEMTK
jgi:hypothetical protein